MLQSLEFYLMRAVFSLKSVLALLLTPIILISGVSASVMYLAGDDAIIATKREYVYSNDRLLLGGYNDRLLEDYSNLACLAKEAGLDFLVTQVNEEFLDQCYSAGIGVIASHYNAASAYYTISENTEAQWMSMSAVTHKAHPALWSDYLIDEPCSQELGKINRILDHYYSLNTGLMPYVNLFPIYANEEQLGTSPQLGWKQYLLPWTTYGDGQFDKYRQHAADYIKTVDTDYISFDVYPYKVFGTNDNWLHNLDILAGACRDTKRDLWVITQAAGNEVYGDGGTSQRWCGKTSDQLQQGYAALAFGAKAVIYGCFQTGWWDPQSHMVDPNGEPTDTYYAVQAANADFALFAEVYGAYQWLGAYTLNSRKAAGLRYELSNGLAKKERLDVISCDGLLVGCFDAKEHEGKAYIITNMAELLMDQSASCCISFPKGKTVTVYGGGEVKTFADGGKVELKLGPGDGRFITAE
ncbi:MAG: hypothetical protein FWF05_07960 [Oscillospiraceae bacterium]|nr:hypothetical protein [Oscillospiraceae bacterium]